MRIKIPLWFKSFLVVFEMIQLITFPIHLLFSDGSLQEVWQRVSYIRFCIYVGVVLIPRAPWVPEQIHQIIMYSFVAYMTLMATLFTFEFVYMKRGSGIPHEKAMPILQAVSCPLPALYLPMLYFFLASTIQFLLLLTHQICVALQATIRSNSQPAACLGKI